MKLNDVAKALGSKVEGDGNRDVRRLVHPADVTSDRDVALALIDQAQKALHPGVAAAVVRPEAAVPEGCAAIRFAGHERMALAILTRLFDPGPAHEPGIHARAVVSADAELGEGVSVGPLAVVGARAKIGAGSVVMPGVTVGADVEIGRDCILQEGVRLLDRVRLGDRVRIGPNTVVGSDGYAVIPVRNPDGTRNPVESAVRIHSLGTVVIADDVEIGAGTTIDRGTLRDTRIGRGTKLDNQVMIAHNVIVGEDCIICGLSGIAGSTVVGDRVILAARASITDHLLVGDDSNISAGAAAIANVEEKSTVWGYPALPQAKAMERYMNVGRLKWLYPRVEEIKKRLDALEKTGKAE